MPEEHLRVIAREIAERAPRRNRILTVKEARILSDLREQSGHLMDELSSAPDDLERARLSAQLRDVRNQLRRAEHHMTVSFPEGEARPLFHRYFPEAVGYVRARAAALRQKGMPSSLNEAERLYTALVTHVCSHPERPIPESVIKKLVDEHLPNTE